jgi:hypothetical protein
MIAENPYDPPKDAADLGGSQSASPLLWSVVTVFGSSLLGSILGLGTGAMIGTIAPGYYRAVFRNGNSADFDPLAVGIGLGMTQGCFLGGVVGLALVAMYYWYRSRSLTATRSR